MAAEGDWRRRYTRISRKHELTLPSAALDAAPRAGDEPQMEADDRGRVLLTPVDDPLEALIGSARGLSAETSLDELRDEWDA